MCNTLLNDIMAYGKSSRWEHYSNLTADTPTVPLKYWLSLKHSIWFPKLNWKQSRPRFWHTNNLTEDTVQGHRAVEQSLWCPNWVCNVKNTTLRCKWRGDSAQRSEGHGGQMWTCWDSAESSVSRSWTTGLLGLLILLPCRSVTALSCFPTPAVRNLCTDPESLSLYSNRLWQSCSIFFSEHRFSYCLHTHSYVTHSSGYLFPLSSFSTRGYSGAPCLLLPCLRAPWNATGEGRTQLCLFVITFF